MTDKEDESKVIKEYGNVAKEILKEFEEYKKKKESNT